MVGIRRHRVAVFAVLGGVLLAGLLGCAHLSHSAPVVAHCGTDGGQLRVMTYNIRTALGTINPGKNPLHQLFESHDVAPVVAAIAAADPDVVALQEVLGLGQAREIATALNMQLAFAYHPSPLPWWGNAVLSKCPILSERRVVTSRGRGNGKAMGVVRIPTAVHPVLVTSVHRDRDDNSGAQIAEILAPLAAATDPVILMGDFNFTPKDPRFSVISERFVDSAEIAQSGRDVVTQTGTFPTKPGRRIDYVFLSGADFDVTQVAVGTGAHAGASDHLSYVADIVVVTAPK